jgi:hypothetical protein
MQIVIAICRAVAWLKAKEGLRTERKGSDWFYLVLSPQSSVLSPRTSVLVPQSSYLSPRTSVLGAPLLGISLLKTVHCAPCDIDQLLATMII